MFFYEMLQEWNQGFDEPFGPKFGDITDSWSSSLRFVCLNRVLGIFKLWFLVQNWRGSRLNLQMEVENVYWRQFWWSSSSKLSKLDLASHTCRPALQIVTQDPYYHKKWNSYVCRIHNDSSTYIIEPPKVRFEFKA